jgi:hypothetical protein
MTFHRPENPNDLARPGAVDATCFEDEAARVVPVANSAIAAN